MTRALKVLTAGPGVTVQDMGREGYLAYGLSRGGAMDRLALAEGAALLGHAGAALEMAGMGGTFQPTEDMRIALTGAPMRVSCDGARLAWNASHLIPAGARLEIGGATAGSYGYLSVAGGITTPERLSARSAHLTAGIGRGVQAGDALPVGPDPGGGAGMTLGEVGDRMSGGTVRIVQSLQTRLFSEKSCARFEETAFVRAARANRMGVRLDSDGPPFEAQGGRQVVSEIIVPGDIQMTGDGVPFVLMAECQTTGGYPRIGTVIPPDLPRVAQAPAGAVLRFRFIALDEAVEALRKETARIAALRDELSPLIRDPHDMRDLLAYSLISGATAGDDLERSET